MIWLFVLNYLSQSALFSRICACACARLTSPQDHCLSTPRYPAGKTPNKAQVGNTLHPYFCCGCLYLYSANTSNGRPHHPPCSIGVNDSELRRAPMYICVCLCPSALHWKWITSTVLMWMSMLMMALLCVVSCCLSFCTVLSLVVLSH